MQEMVRRGVDAGIYSPSEGLDTNTTLVFDAWSVFPTVCDANTADDLVQLAAVARRAGARVVVDNCDNQFAAETQQANWLAGLARLRILSGAADVLVYCSRALQEAMRGEVDVQAPGVVIDDPIEEVIQYPGDRRWHAWASPAQKMAALRLLAHATQVWNDRLRGRTPMAWFGSHGNQFAQGGMLDLLSRRELLHSIHRTWPLSLNIISNHRRKFEVHFRDWQLPVRYLEWDRVTFIQALKLHNISLIPSIDNPFTRCKSSNRLTLSIHHGLSVVADPVDAYRKFEDVVRLGDWETNLRRLLEDPARRQYELELAQSRVRATHSLAQITTDWLRPLCADLAWGGDTP